MPMEIGVVMSTCACCGKAGHEKARCRFRNAKRSNCPGCTRHFTGYEEGRDPASFSDEIFARFFALGVERQENFQLLISRIFILPFTSSNRDNDRLQTWFSPDFPLRDTRRRGPTSCRRGRHASFLAPSHSTGSGVFPIPRAITITQAALERLRRRDRPKKCTSIHSTMSIQHRSGSVFPCYQCR